MMMAGVDFKMLVWQSICNVCIPWALLFENQGLLLSSAIERNIKSENRKISDAERSPAINR